MTAINTLGGIAGSLILGFFALPALGLHASALLVLPDEIQLRWFDHWLKGEENGIMDEPPVRIFVMGDNAWRDEGEWPLARTRYTPYYLHSGGGANSLHGDGGRIAALAHPSRHRPGS